VTSGPSGIRALRGHEYRDLGDRVVVARRCRVRGRTSGAESHPVCAWVVAVRDGMIVSHRTSATYDEALLAAGVKPAGDHAG
jgi:ketosteroid isomerase-like protein